MCNPGNKKKRKGSRITETILYTAAELTREEELKLK